MNVLGVTKSLHIHQKTVLVFILLMLLVYAAGFYVSLDVQSQVRAELRNTMAMRVDYLAREIAKDVSNLRTQQLQMKTDVSVQKMLLFSGLNDMGAVTDLVNDINRRVVAIRLSSRYIDEVAVCFSQLDRSVTTAGFYRPESSTDKKLMQILASSDANVVFDDGLYLIEGLNTRRTSLQRTSLCYIRLSLPTLQQALSEVASSSDISVYLLHKDGVVLSAGSNINGLAAALPDGGDLSQFPLTVDGQRYVGTRQHIDELDMDLVACMPEQAIAKIMMKNQIWMIALTALTIAGFIAFVLFANRSISWPIRRLVRAFQEIEHDNLDVKIENRAFSEFDYLYKAFNNMTGRLKVSIQQEYQHEIARQRAELRQLQAQINPHFLYNSFYHIYRMCKMEDNEGAADLSLKLSSFYQYITRSGQESVPLAMEYGHAQDYCQIQSTRYGSRVQTFFSPLSDKITALPVPKLILQPVLENAYLYSSEQRVQSTEIHVSAHCNDEYLVIVVEDNGDGMDEESLANLSHRLMNTSQDGETTGLLNVSRRLHIRYGGKSGITLAKSSYGGLRVELRIWCTKEDKDEKPEVFHPQPIEKALD